MGNNGFTTEDYPEPDVWAGVLRSVELKEFEYFADHLEPVLFEDVWRQRTEFFTATLDAIRENALEVFSGATARVSYILNMLSHPFADMRRSAMRWCRAFVDMTLALGGKYISGHYDCMSQREVAENFAPAMRRLVELIVELSTYSAERGLEGIFLEQMHRPQLQPYTIRGAQEMLAAINDRAAVPVHMHIDTGHAAHVRGYSDHTAEDRDPYAWLAAAYGRNDKLLIHAQQTDDQASRHWPFTAHYNERGLIDAERVIEAVESSGVKECYVAMEILYPRATRIDMIKRELGESVEYWRSAFERRGYEKQGRYYVSHGSMEDACCA